MTPYAFARGLGYSGVVAASEGVAWSVDEIFRERGFDASAPIVPSSWVGADALAFLDARDRLVLNHCRAFSYVHILRNFEEFAPPHLVGAAAAHWHDERVRLRALLRFADEEMKHQQLFLRAERILEECCGFTFGGYFDDGGLRVAEVTHALLEHSPLARFLVVLALEWGTQRHYVESVRGTHAADALYADLLRAHWVEEAQHTKVDMLEIATLAATMGAAARTAAFDELLAIGDLVDGVLAEQTRLEIATLAIVRGRSFSDAERAALERALHGSLGSIMSRVGLSHPAFALVARELSPEGAAKLGLA
jgi:hypothetical protein